MVQGFVEMDGTLTHMAVALKVPVTKKILSWAVLSMIWTPRRSAGSYLNPLWY